MAACTCVRKNCSEVICDDEKSQIRMARAIVHSTLGHRLIITVVNLTEKERDERYTQRKVRNKSSNNTIHINEINSRKKVYFRGKGGKLSSNVLGHSFLNERKKATRRDMRFSLSTRICSQDKIRNSVYEIRYTNQEKRCNSSWSSIYRYNCLCNILTVVIKFLYIYRNFQSNYII